jgi:hypothetical protein
MAIIAKGSSPLLMMVFGSIVKISISFTRWAVRSHSNFAQKSGDTIL